MIILKEQGINEISVQKPLSDAYNGKYTVIAQNTVTKELFKFDVEDKNADNSIYFKFELVTDRMIDGEYILVVCHNPFGIELEFDDITNIFETIKNEVAIVNGEDEITNDGALLVNTEQGQIAVLSKDIMRIGEFNATATEYNNNTNEYITYNG